MNSYTKEIGVEFPKLLTNKRGLVILATARCEKKIKGIVVRPVPVDFYRKYLPFSDWDLGFSIGDAIDTCHIEEFSDFDGEIILTNSPIASKELSGKNWIQRIAIKVFGLSRNNLWDSIQDDYRKSE